METHDPSSDVRDTANTAGPDDTPHARDTAETTSLLAAERHAFDPLSAVFGLLFVVVAGLALAGELRPLALGGQWIGPVLLIGIGLALVTTIRRDR